MNTRSLPHSLEAERAALGSVLIKPAAIDDLSDLAADDFFLPAHREILDAMRALCARGRAVDVVLLADELKAMGMLGRLDGGALYLNALADSTPTAENVGHYARQVASKAMLRRLIAVCGEIQSSAYGDLGDVEEFVSEARAKIAGVELHGGGGPTLIGEEVERTLKSIEDRGQSPEDYFVQTGFRAFDRQISGLRGGNLIVVAGRPGGGKSAWTQDVLLHAAGNGVPCLLFSFEMTKVELTERAFSKRGEVNGHSVVTGRLSGPEWMRLHKASGQIAGLPLWLETRNMTGPRICSETRRWFARQPVVVRNKKGEPRKVGMMAVDYAGLAKPTGQEDTREREIAELAEGLKRLAAELDIPVILVSQLNRENEKAQRPPRLSDLRESGSLEQAANMVIFPWWEGDPANQGRHAAYLLVKKNRGGPRGDIPVDWQPEFVRFIDKEDFVDEPEQQNLL